MRTIPSVTPADRHNLHLREQVHPPRYQNPAPSGPYNLVVIGAGTAGLVCAAGAAGVGAKVALIERHFLGGDCLNTGCVPSKSLIRAARAVHDVRLARTWGVRTLEPEVDFARVMENLRRVRAVISHHDSVERFSKLGVEVHLGQPRFTGPRAVEIEGRELAFSHAVIATGARAARPAIPGLEEAGYLTNETVFDLTQRPKRLAVIGGGPIGCELAQAFRRLGSEVSLIHNKNVFLDREDPDAAGVVEAAFRKDGVRLMLGAVTKRVEKTAGGKRVVLGMPGGDEELEVDEILVAVGRVPNIEGLGLEAAGVETDPKLGVTVDDRLRTTNSRIYAAGDVCMKHKFTHAADFAARLVVQNALFLGRRRVSALTIPRCTYTDPEIAHVGLTEWDARERGEAIDTYLRRFSDVDRAITDGEEEGFVKIHCAAGTDRIVGGTIVARHAGDMIGEVALALTARVGLGTLANVIHPYPTKAEAIRQCGDAYNRTRLTSLVKRAFDFWLRKTR